jgi:hypothetical protein
VQVAQIGQKGQELGRHRVLGNVSKPVRLDFCLEAHVKMLLAVVLVLFTLGPPAHAQGTAAPAIDRIIAEFVDTFNARDLTKLEHFRLRCSADLRVCGVGRPEGLHYTEVKNAIGGDG